MYSITKNFKFEASHRLFSMPETHACHNLHGHSYVVKVTISTKKLNKIKNQNMIIDFGELKIIQKWLDENFDHATILHVEDPLYPILKEAKCKVRMMPNGDTTAENMSSFFHKVFGEIIKQHLSESFILKVEVAETIGNSASYEEEIII